MKNKLYILIDKNLDPIYGAVQGGHAVAEWLLEHWYTKHNNDWNEDYPIWEWNNDYLIYLQVDIQKLLNKLWKFDPNNFRWSYFREPDLDNQITAIAIYEKDFPSSIIKELMKEKLLKE